VPEITGMGVRGVLRYVETFGGVEGVRKIREEPRL